MKVNNLEIHLLGKTVHCALKTLHVFPVTASLSQKPLTSAPKAAVLKSSDYYSTSGKIRASHTCDGENFHS